MTDTSIDTLLAELAARRSVLKGIGLGTAALTAASVCPGTARADTAGDVALLNFALNFEYLGAEYYLAALGTSLAQFGKKSGLANLTGGGIAGGPTGGPVSLPADTAVPFRTQSYLAFAQHLAADEVAHVIALETIINANQAKSAVIEPIINLNTGPTDAWSVFAAGAGLIAQGQTFNPFASEIDFLIGAYVLEDMCVSALAGAAAFLTLGSANLSYAASILGTEGYQSGMIRSQLSAIGAGPVTDAISAYRSTLSNRVQNVGVDDLGTDANGNPFNFTNADVNGQAFRRTPQQVLAVAYGAPGPGTSRGLFFPNGVNGSISST